jgi:ComF family protein
MRALLDGLSFLGRGTLGIVLPSPCAVCAGPLPWFAREASCCASCWSRLPRLEGVRCRRCAVIWRGAPDDADYLCLHCVAQRDDPIERILAWGEYRDGLERLLVSFKFRGADFLAGPLADLLVDRWRSSVESGYDAVAAVPMHPRKLRARGYNQALLLARQFARRAKLPLHPRALRKVRDTEPQSTLQREARGANVRRAFAADRGAAGRSFLLIDDICTTGATIRACAAALRASGARRVTALTVARA